MILNFEYKNKNTRVSVRGLPRVRDKVVTVKKTPDGEVLQRRILNGRRPIEGDIAQALLNSNDEIDLKKIGTVIDQEPLSTAYTRNGKAVGDFTIMERVLLPDGSVKEEKSFVQKLANINGIVPIKVAKTFPLDTILTRFVCKAVYQITPEDGEGLSYHFLKEIAQDLQDKKEAALIGSGAKGTGPLILRDGALPARGFLVGKVEDDRYQLLLLISDMDMRRPEAAPPAATPASENDVKKVAMAA